MHIILLTDRELLNVEHYLNRINFTRTKDYTVMYSPQNEIYSMKFKTATCKALALQKLNEIRTK